MSIKNLWQKYTSVLLLCMSGVCVSFQTSNAASLPHRPSQTQPTEHQRQVIAALSSCTPHGIRPLLSIIAGYGPIQRIDVQRASENGVKEFAEKGYDVSKAYNPDGTLKRFVIARLLKREVIGGFEARLFTDCMPSRRKHRDCDSISCECFQQYSLANSAGIAKISLNKLLGDDQDPDNFNPEETQRLILTGRTDVIDDLPVRPLDIECATNYSHHFYRIEKVGSTTLDIYKIAVKDPAHDGQPTLPALSNLVVPHPAASVR